MNEVILQIFRIVSIFMFSFLLTLLIFPWWFYILVKYRLGKNIRKEGAPIYHSMHQKKAGTPTMGGLLIWLIPFVLAILFSMLSSVNDFIKWLSFLERRETYLPLAFLVLAGILGFLDDLFGVFKIGPKGGGIGVNEKIIIYTGLALLIAWWFIVKLGITFIPFPFIGRIYVGIFWYAVFIILFVLGITFSANETDGLDGLLGGITLGVLIALLIITFFEGDYNLASLISAIIGSTLAFLWFNIYPARVFMGDTGSMAIGIFLSLIFLLEGIPIYAPIFLPIFVLEAGSVILQVFSKKFFKKKIFLSAPIHHHFEALGNHEASIVFKFWVINGIGVILGLTIWILEKIA